MQARKRERSELSRGALTIRKEKIERKCFFFSPLLFDDDVDDDDDDDDGGDFVFPSLSLFIPHRARWERSCASR